MGGIETGIEQDNEIVHALPHRAAGQSIEALEEDEQDESSASARLAGR